MKIFFYLSSLLILLTSCIGEDIIADTIPEVLRITSNVDDITINSTEQLNASFFNNIGVQEDVIMLWESSNPNTLSITEDGIIQGVSLGTATVTVSFGDISDEIEISIVEQGEENNNNQIVELSQITGSIGTTTFYDLTGDFTLSEVEDGGLDLSFANNYDADTGLPGLYVYLTNNPNSIANALEIGPVQIFNGTHSYSIPNATLNEYGYILYWCKPFGVKVGQGNLQN